MGSIVQTCKECKEKFTLDSRDVDWFKSRGLHVPKRCKACRQKKSNIQLKDITFVQS